MSNRLKIVVLTPVKNEAWILPRFLAVTSRFADHIIVADQNSTDDSREICERCAKVTLIHNQAENYNESERQSLLINSARKLVPSPKILLALDADEIAAADGPSSPGWRKMLDAQPGTVLSFEKPDLCEIPDRCVRFPNRYWPLGYVDDGLEHDSSLIHGRRVPLPKSARELKINDVKFLHYNLVRWSANESKRRMYCLIEALAGTMPWTRRILNYRAGIDWTNQGPNEICQETWFKQWEEIGIDMRTVIDTRFHWQDAEVLRMMKKFGEQRFHWDDIWHFDWEACRQWAISNNYNGIPTTPVMVPGPIRRSLLKVAQIALMGAQTCYRAVKH